MGPDEYLRAVIAKHRPSVSPLSVALLRATLQPSIQQWAGGYLREMSVSGSHAKGTAIAGQTDVDFFISLQHRVPENLREIFESLLHWARLRGWLPKAQNVSVGVQVNGLAVDLVPARVQSGYRNRHSLYRRKADSWTETDVSRHISLIQNSQRIEEIKLAKIWRARNGLELPSFPLELAVLEATRGRRYGNVSGNFWAVLQYLAEDFRTARLIDPANSNNVVSDDVTSAEKVRISQAAMASRRQTYWERIVW